MVLQFFFRVIGAVIDFCMDFRWRPWRDVRFSYPTCLRTRIWNCYIYNNTFTIGTPPSHKTSILSQSRCDKPLELRSTTWFLPYTFGNCEWSSPYTLRHPSPPTLLSAWRSPCQYLRPSSLCISTEAEVMCLTHFVWKLMQFFMMISEHPWHQHRCKVTIHYTL